MAELDRRIHHHDLCFGCGQANLFGLQMECELSAHGGVEGRFFVKQDHQGPPGHAHGGVTSAALDEVMALLLRAEGISAPTARLEIDLLAPVPVGSFVHVAAEVEQRDHRKLVLSASASDPAGAPLAAARGVFVRVSR